MFLRISTLAAAITSFLMFVLNIVSVSLHHQYYQGISMAYVCLGVLLDLSLTAFFVALFIRQKKG